MQHESSKATPAVQSCHFLIPECVCASISVSTSDENQNPNKHQGVEKQTTSFPGIKYLSAGPGHPPFPLQADTSHLPSLSPPPQTLVSWRKAPTVGLTSFSHPCTAAFQWPGGLFSISCFLLAGAAQKQHPKGTGDGGGFPSHLHPGEQHGCSSQLSPSLVLGSAWVGHAVKQCGGISMLGLHGWRCLLASSEPQAAPQICSDREGHRSVAQQVSVSPLLPKSRHHLAPLPFQISALRALQ